MREWHSRADVLAELTGLEAENLRLAQYRERLKAEMFEASRTKEIALGRVKELEERLTFMESENQRLHEEAASLRNQLTTQEAKLIETAGQCFKVARRFQDSDDLSTTAVWLEGRLKRLAELEEKEALRRMQTPMGAIAEKHGFVYGSRSLSEWVEERLCQLEDLKQRGWRLPEDGLWEDRARAAEAKLGALEKDLGGVRDRLANRLLAAARQLGGYQENDGELADWIEARFRDATVIPYWKARASEAEGKLKQIRGLIPT